MPVFSTSSLVPSAPQRQRSRVSEPRHGAVALPGESERLAASATAGDRAAFEQLYRRHGATTFALLRHQLRDHGAAEDVQQQVWLQIWQRLSSFDPAQASFLTWLLLITRSRAIDHQRRRQPEPRDPHSEILAGSQDTHADEMLERWRVADALARLPREEAQMLRMRFHDGLSQREIAERTGVALGTVKHRMVDGLARLRRLLADEEPT